MGEMILLVLGILAYIVIFPIYLANRVTQLSKTVEKLQQQLSSGAHASTALEEPEQVSTPPANQAVPMPPQPAPTPGQLPSQPQPVVESDPAFVAWLKQDFLMKLGAFLLLVAFGWFVSYAFANNWIGPMGRITLGLIAGVMIMVLGIWRIRAFLHQGAVFVALGSTVVLLTVYAAREIYDFFTPATALVMMFAAVSFVAFVSVRYKNEPLSLAGLLLAGIAPLLTASPDPSLLSLMSYLMVILLGTLWVVYLTRANSLVVAALFIVGFYSAPYLIGYQSVEDRVLGLLFSFAFTTVFFIANITSILFKRSGAARQGQIITAFFTGVYLMSWIAFAAADEWHSLLYVAWMLVFALGAFIVYTRTNDRRPFYIYGAVGVALLAAATAAELDGPFLTIAYAIEVAALVSIVSVGFKNRQLASKTAWLFIGPILLSMESLTAASWESGVIHWDAAVLVVATLSLAVISLVLLEPDTAVGGPHKTTAMPGEISAIGAIIYFLALIWLFTHGLLSDDLATMISLVIYTVIGLSMYVRGVITEQPALKYGGGILLALVIARLFLVDVWSMALVGRISTFFAVGILLMSTAFISRLVHKSEQ